MLEQLAKVVKNETLLLNIKLLITDSLTVALA